MNFNDIFTQYDEGLEKVLEIDPMGFSAIWTHFGQEIFNNKISSVALDVRSFNINLFNHFVIRNLIEDSSSLLQNQFKKDLKTAIEKLLIILENMIIWSWYKDSYVSDDISKDWGDTKNGLLGTSKAISKWQNKDINLDITDDITNLEILKRQKILGVNGRYKGSFINMGFFTSNYDFDEYFDDELFDNTKELIENNNDLYALFNFIIKFFKNENLVVEDIQTELFTNVFKNNQSVTNDTKSFWLNKLGFKSNDAKNIYDTIDITISYNWDEIKNIFTIAKSIENSSKIDMILSLEPKLSYLDGILHYLTFFDSVEIDKLSKKEHFFKLKNLDFDEELSLISKDCAAKKRLQELNQVDSIEKLIEYHKNIMEERGHYPWINIDDNTIKASVKKIKNKEGLSDKLKDEFSQIQWIHDYYLSSVLNIKKGFKNGTL